MNGVDTNVLARLFLTDDEQQRRASERLLADSTAHPLFINLIVVVEFAWVLRQNRIGESRVAMWLSELLSSDEFIVSDEPVIRRALDRHLDSGLSLADCLIAELNLAAGCDTTFTFDREAARVPGFSLVSPAPPK